MNNERTTEESDREKAERARRIWEGVKAHLADSRALFLVLAVYLLLLLSRRIDALLAERSGQYLSVVLLQILVLAVPAFFYIRVQAASFRDRLRLTRLRPSCLPLVASAVLLTVTGSLLIGIVLGKMTAFSGNFTLYDTFISTQNAGFIGNLRLILAYALFPALCEELIFRAILCTEYEGNGFIPAVSLSSLFFGMLHFDFPKLPIYLYAGVILALTYYATQSLFGSIAVHVFFNLFGLYGQGTLYSFYKNSGGSELFTFLVLLLFLVSAIAFSALASRLYHTYALQNRPSDYRPRLPLRESLHRLAAILFTPESLLCIIVYAINVI